MMLLNYIQQDIRGASHMKAKIIKWYRSASRLPNWDWKAQPKCRLGLSPNYLSRSDAYSISEIEDIRSR